MFNIAYVILAAQRNVLCWPVGIVGLMLSLVVYVEARLFSDATLQVSYLVMSIYGWYMWYRIQSKPFVIQHANLKLHAKILMTGTLAGLGMGWFWHQFGADLPYLDGLTTSFSLIATWLTARRYLQSWIYWIFIDFICIGIYFHKGIVAFVVLFVVYTLLAFWGYRKWQNYSKSEINLIHN